MLNPKSQQQGVHLSKPQINYQLSVSCVKTKIQEIDVYTPYEPYDTQKTYMSYIIKCLNNGETGVIQSPTGTGKTLSLLSSTIAWQYHNHQRLYPNVPQIYYTSRTHQQLKQSISQLKKLPFNIKSAVLSSRQQSCINLDLKQLNSKDKGFECRKRITHQQGKSCIFYKNDKFYDDLQYNGKVMDLDDIVFRGKCEKFCPYFYNKNLKNKAHIIFMPYNYLFEDSYVLEENGINLKNAILIIDEAHNIQQALQQSKQYSFTLNILSRALTQISEMHEEKLTQLKTQSTTRASNYLEDIEDFGKPIKWNKRITSPLESIQYHASYVSLVHFYFQTIDIPNGPQGKTFNIKQFIEIIQKATQDSEFGVITKRLSFIIKELKSLRDDLKFRPFWALQSWASFIQKIWQLYKIYQKDKISAKFKIQILYEGSDIKLNVYCLDPSAAMDAIMAHKPHSVILTSGTLSPIKSFTMQLNLNNVQAVSCPHIIQPGQAKTYIVTKGPNMKLNFSYQNRSNRDMYNELGLVLTQIIKNTKNGVVVFFPSYMFLQETVKNLNAGKLLSKIYQHKSLHIESKQNTQFAATLEKYLKDSQSQKGAVLFALIRGKISQGLDFSDNKCRAVVIVGVPYPARKDIKVVAKIQYLNQLASKDPSNVLNGQKWYLSEAIRSINQGMGRIIRHKKDYGSIYLLDERYDKEKPDLKGQLSSWARASLTVITNYYDLADEWKRTKDQFMLPKETKQPQQTKATKRSFVFGSLKSITGQFKSRNDPYPTPLNTDHEKKQKTPSLKSMIEEIKKNQQDIIKPKLNEVVQKQQQQNEQKQSILSSTQKETQQNNQQQKPQQQKQPLSSTTIISRQKQIFMKTTKIAPLKKQKIVPIDQLEECPVCRLSKKLVKNTECIHKICSGCWQEWLVKDLRCPFCRIRIRVKYLNMEDGKQ